MGRDIAPWPPTRWTPETLTLAAFYYSPALDVARAQWETAKAGIEVADAVPNPVLQLPFQYNAPNPGPGSPFTLGAALDIPIETAHKRGYRVDQASHLSEAARLNIANEAWKVRSRVWAALVALYAAREQSGFLNKTAAAERQIAEMSTKRLAAGQFSQPDVDAAVLADTKAQADLAAARSAEEDARAARGGHRPADRSTRRRRGRSRNLRYRTGCPASGRSAARHHLPSRRSARVACRLRRSRIRASARSS
ncbi:MAG TPA: TolC family protein [Trinickia sp.]|uniref:TolC family protein n=1 Tax=Trinickia sp. TaxID=2571163 RepID=UPI002F411CAE